MARKKSNPKSTTDVDIANNDSEQTNAKNEETKEYCVKVKGGTKYMGPYGEVFIPDDEDEEMDFLEEDTERSELKDDPLEEIHNPNSDDQENVSMDLEENDNGFSWNPNEGVLDTEEDDETKENEIEEDEDKDEDESTTEEIEDEGEKGGETAIDNNGDQEDDLEKMDDQETFSKGKENNYSNQKNAMEENNKLIIHDKLTITKIKKEERNLPDIKVKSKANIAQVTKKLKVKDNENEEDSLEVKNYKENNSEEKEEPNIKKKIVMEDKENKILIHDKLTITKVNGKKEKAKNEITVPEMKAKSKATITKVTIKKEIGDSSDKSTDSKKETKLPKITQAANYKVIKQEKVKIKIYNGYPLEYNANKKPKKNVSNLSNPEEKSILSSNDKKLSLNEDNNIPTFEIETKATVKMETKIETENISENYWENLNNLDIKSMEDPDTSSDAMTALQCIPCQKTFPKNWNLKLHMTTQRHFKMLNIASTRASDSLDNLLLPGTIFSCDICQKDFPTHIKLDVHLQTKSHLRIMRGGKRYTCDVCTMGLSSKTNLKIHLKTHTGVKSYKCDACPKAFGQGIGLERHKKRHTGIKDFPCTQCPKAFYETQNLRNHMVIHTGEKPFTCEQCWKCFSQVKSLKIHTMIHNGIKPFGCSQCDYKVVDKGALKKHMRKHTGEKPYSCDMCPQRFGYYETWKKHELKHGEDKPFVCKICLYSTGDERCLIKHTKLHKD